MGSAAFCLALVLVSLVPADNPLLRYRIPDARASAFTISFGHCSGWEFGTRANNTAYSRLYPKYELLVLGERLNVSGSVGTSLGADPLRARYFTDDEGGGFNTRGGTYGIDPRLVVTGDWYPTRLPLGIGADINTRAHLWYRHFNPDSSDYAHIPEQSDIPKNQRYWSLNGDLSIGPALGRMREARTVVLALRIGEILEEEMLLEREFAEDDAQELAQLLSRDQEFLAKHHRPIKDFYQELERLLVARGLIPAKVPAYAWFRIKEAVGTQGFYHPGSYGSGELVGSSVASRPVGVRLSVRAGVHMRKWDSRTVFADSTVTGCYFNKTPELRIRLETEYPLDTKWQLSQDCSWNIFSESIGTVHRLYARVAASYQVFDQLLVSTSYSGRFQDKDIHYWLAEPYTNYHILEHGPDATLKYYLEDRLSLSSSLRLDIERYRRDSRTAPWTASSQLSCRFSLEYRLK